MTAYPGSDTSSDTGLATDSASGPSDASGVQLPDTVLAAAEAMVNHVLALDPESIARLAPVHGRVLLVELTGFGTRIYVVPGEGRLFLFGSYEAAPDCIVRGSPVALLAMVLAEHREDAVFAGAVQIDGDNHLAQVLGEVFRDLDIDWEEQLSKLLGDTLAHHLTSRARAGERWAGRSGTIARQNLREYLQEEAAVLPSRHELADFLAAVDTLRDDVERLAARVERLERAR
jgi:ubiquinone biosynthesis protein UbiJ